MAEAEHYLEWESSGEKSHAQQRIEYYWRDRHPDLEAPLLDDFTGRSPASDPADLETRAERILAGEATPANANEAAAYRARLAQEFHDRMTRWQNEEGGMINEVWEEVIDE